MNLRTATGNEDTKLRRDAEATMLLAGDTGSHSGAIESDRVAAFRKGRRRRSLLFAGRLLVAYLALFGFTRWFPTFWPRCIAVLVPSFVEALDSDYEVGDIRVDHQFVVVDTVSRKFEKLETVQGGSGPSFSFNPDLQVEALNLYPVIVFTVLLAWPMSLRLRLVSLCFAVVLALVACALDLAGVVLWWGGQWLSEAWIQVRNMIRATPENLVHFEALEAHEVNLQWVNWAVSTSRPFIAIFIAVLSVGLGMVLFPSKAFGRGGGQDGLVP